MLALSIDSYNRNNMKDSGRGIPVNKDEFSLIRHLTSRTGEVVPVHHSVAVGIGDDAAVVDASEGFQWVLSCDTMVETVHFNERTMRDSDIGFKAMASNVSDMAAMGAIPEYALVAISVPPSWSEERLRRIYGGLYECADRYGVAVIGGDTTSAPQHLTLTVTVTGRVEKGSALLRSSARPGDIVFVTGYLGRSAAGMDVLASGADWAAGSPQARLAEAHRRPVPQVEAGRLLLKSGAHPSLNDISDGLASEAWEIAEASGVGVRLDAALIPVHPDLREYGEAVGKDPLDWILYGGEDYQLVGSMPANAFGEAVQAFDQAGLSLYAIGEIHASAASVTLSHKDGDVPVAKRGYNHFA